MEKEEMASETIPKKYDTGKVVKMRCWMCKKRMVEGFNERCEKCRLNNCLHCGQPLTKLQRLLPGKEDELLGDIIKVCTSRDCPVSFRVATLKGYWKTIKDE